MKNCRYCNKNNKCLRCSKCKKVYYCSRECQMQDLEVHKIVCAPDKINAIYFPEIGDPFEMIASNPINAEEILKCENVEIISCEKFQDHGYHLGIYIVSNEGTEVKQFKFNTRASKLFGIDILGPILIVNDNDKELIHLELKDIEFLYNV